MDAEAAIAFVDQLLLDKGKKRLTDTQRVVFRGAWQGKSYKEIHQECPRGKLDNIMRNVGPELWLLLSDVLEEEVNKNNLQGPVERTFWVTKTKETVNSRIFISDHGRESDFNLVQHLCNNLQAAGHEVFVAGESIRLSANWSKHFIAELDQCDCFVLFLSPKAATSEMVTEEVRQVRQLYDTRTGKKPTVILIRIGMSFPLNHDLRGYLAGMQVWEWRSPLDTPQLLQAVLDLLAKDRTEKADLAESRSVIQTDIRAQEFSSEGNQLNQLTAVSYPHSSQSFSPPLPVAEPELPVGQVRLTSKFYVERPPVESLCYQEILQPGALIRIKAPRQMGKTSLMARVLYQARQQGYRAVPLSFQLAASPVFTDLDKFFQWFCASVSQNLRLPNQLSDYWDDIFDSAYNSTAYFENYLLPETSSPLVIGLDEVDRVFSYAEIANDFLGILRAWYEKAKYGDSNSEIWENLRLVVVHSTEVYIPMNVNQSPFNVGLSVELQEFTSEQVHDLAQRYRLDWQTVEIEHLCHLVAGHPYLIRLAMYHVASGNMTLVQLLQTAPTEAGPYSDHLRRHLWNLEQFPELAIAFREVIAADQPIELRSELAFRLHGMGLVKKEGNYVMPHCDLYRQYFRQRLRTTEL